MLHLIQKYINGLVQNRYNFVYNLFDDLEFSRRL